MVKNLSLVEFLKRNRIDNDTWKKANIEWATLQAIAEDHEAAFANLEKTAEFFAKVIQKFNGVHSVRWRVKDSEHLIVKIVRKRSEGNPKYSDIAQYNYFECVTDLIGVRALHLFKENCFEIDAALKAEWNPVETPVAYIRVGDSENFRSRFSDEGFEVKNHPAGYRSVHYVIESTPLKRKIFSEIQVRTIFEEGWSEIDHKIRYPNFSDNKLVEYFLEIFNRMAGSADDMGGFVLGLVATISQMEEEICVIKKEKESAFQDVEKALNQLESVKKQDKASRESIAALKAEIAKFKAVNQVSQNLGMFDFTIAEEAKRLSELASAPNLRGLGMFDSTIAQHAKRLSELASVPTLRSLGMVDSTLAAQANRLSDLAIVPTIRGLGMVDSTAAKQVSLGIIDLSDTPKPSATGLVNSKASEKKE